MYLYTQTSELSIYFKETTLHNRELQSQKSDPAKIHSLVQTDLSKLKPSPVAQASFLEDVLEGLEVTGKFRGQEGLEVCSAICLPSISGVVHTKPHRQD